MDYEKFVENKTRQIESVGFEPKRITAPLYEYQKAIVRWGLRKGRFACFAGTGSGKTIMELEVARQIGGRVLIIAPLAVSRQTIHEGKKFGYSVNYAPDGEHLSDGINITNYERIGKFEAPSFRGVILDESSILKSFSGSIRNELIERFSGIKYRSCWTATPAPNDFMEIGNHAEFLGIMRRTEMLAMYFTHDGSDTSKWRLKGHASKDFWKWMGSWSIMFSTPGQIGFPGDDIKLPGLEYHEHICNSSVPQEGHLFAMPAKTLQERNYARKNTTEERSKIAAKIINKSDEQWIVWCGLNDESEIVSGLIKDAVEVTGSDSDLHKEESAVNFAGKKIRVLVSKGKIYGWGLNFQNCHNVMFLGMNDSWELFYQSIRRCWRRGQKKTVHVHIISSSQESEVLANIKEKEKAASKMLDEMIRGMADITKKELKTIRIEEKKMKRNKLEKEKYTLYHDDCINAIKEIRDDSVHYSIFSPPFSSLYVYSDSELDMGNSASDEQFREHFGFLTPELFRVIMPGRLLSFHCSNIMATKEKDGFMGIKDFRGDLIRAFEKVGFVFHSEVLIWKDPLIQATRTKQHGLLHKNIVKDAAMCQQGFGDYIITMRKPGANSEPVTHPKGFTEYVGEDPPVTSDIRKLSHYIWQRYASPVWSDIKQSDTLNYRAAREGKDERHICPLQLDVIRRCLDLWTNPDDIVFSPFMGIGSEGYEALKNNRRFIGIELKESYYLAACQNIERGQQESVGELFAQKEA